MPPKTSKVLQIRCSEGEKSSLPPGMMGLQAHDTANDITTSRTEGLEVQNTAENVSASTARNFKELLAEIREREESLSSYTITAASFEDLKEGAEHLAKEAKSLAAKVSATDAQFLESQAKSLAAVTESLTGQIEPPAKAKALAAKNIEILERVSFSITPLDISS